MIFGKLNVSAQHLGSNDILSAQWKAAKQATVLLQNNKEVIPVKNLGNTNISWRSFGLGEDNDFSKTLLKYTTNHLRIGIKNQLFIIAIHPEATTEEDRAGVKEILRLQIPTLRRIVVVFNNAEFIANTPELQKADALLYIKDINSLTQSIAAQIIFGAEGAEGILDKDIGEHFKANTGVKTQGNLRLGYRPSDNAKMNSTLLKDSIDAIITQAIQKRAFPGAQVLVAIDGKVVFHETYGFHTYDSAEVVKPEDLYDFASVTKVTSTLPALMKMHGEGKFALDAPLKKYFPFFKKTEKGEVTYREYLSHYGRLRPGIVFWRLAKDDNGSWKPKTFKHEKSKLYPTFITDSLFLRKNYKKEIYKGIKDLPLNQKKEYVYSDLSFILYPYIVERLSRQKLEPYLKRTFYEPLGAFSLTYNPLNYFPKSQIVPTEQDTFFRKILVHGTVHDENAAMLGGISGHAGLFGSTNDLAKLFQMYLNGGVYGGERLIPEFALKEFTRCQYCDEGVRRGLGFDKPTTVYNEKASYWAKSASPLSFGHSGYTGTFVWADPSYNLLVVIMTNRVHPYRSSNGISELNIRPRVQQAAYDAIIKR